MTREEFDSLIPGDKIHSIFNDMEWTVRCCHDDAPGARAYDLERPCDSGLWFRRAFTGLAFTPAIWLIASRAAPPAEEGLTDTEELP